jgi:uncharacterized protein
MEKNRILVRFFPNIFRPFIYDVDNIYLGDKKTMKKNNIIFAIALCAIVFGTLASVSYAREPSTPQAGDLREVLGDITMPGQAQMNTKPDLVVITLRIQSLNIDSVVTAKNHVAEILDRVIRALKQLGLTDDQIETLSYHIEQQYNWENNVNVFKGYLVSCSLKISVKDADKAGKVIDVSVDEGAYVDNINFELSKEKEAALKKQLLSQAVDDAKEKANSVMVALGQHLGRAKSVSMNADYQPHEYYRNDGTNGAFALSIPTTIMQSDLTVTVTVTIGFEILP